MRPEAIYERELEEGLEVVVYPMIYTTRVCIGEVGSGTYRRAWCYPDPARAVEAAQEWDGIGDPPVGWIKEVGTERRRVNGDPEREFDGAAGPWPEVQVGP